MKNELKVWLKVYLVTLLLTLCNSEPSFFDSFSFLSPSVRRKSVEYSSEPDEISSRADNSLRDLKEITFPNAPPFIQRRLFNTSVALTVPLFSFTLPQRAAQGSSIDLANQAIFGLFALLVTIMIFTVPVLFTGVRPATGRSNDGGTQGILNHLMASSPVFNLMNADLSHKIGLDSTKCLQKSICESHRYPKNKHYGLLALPFQIFFPPPAKETSKSKVSSFQLAAREGKYTKKECGQQFKCFFDIMDLAVYFVDWYHYTADPDSYYQDEVES